MLDPFAHRRTGVLLHPTSLPGQHQQGKLNTEAFDFIDFLNSCGVTIWQMLPLGPTQQDGSPYQSYSSFAINPKLLDLEIIRQWGCLPEHILESCLNSETPLKTIHQAFSQHADEAHQTLFSTFVGAQSHWLSDYALYRVLKSEFAETSWLEWPTPFRKRDPSALREFAQNQAEKIQQIQFEQFVLFNVWQQIRNYAALKNIKIFGDLPIFVSHDSADVWANPSLFVLDESGKPLTVAGVPPDYFSETGQRWGNPHYRWEEMEKDNYAWWLARLSHHLKLFDLVRIDHFRGLESYWEIPASEETAIKGTWKKSPGKQLLSLFQAHFKALPIVAEDLGIITKEVEALRDEYNLPGMKILQFAFDSDAHNPYLPHNHVTRSVVYTGTHDNNTTLGWYRHLDDHIRDNCLQYLNFPKEPMPWPLIQSALSSVAQTAIIPMQDLLSLDEKSRMNTPGTTVGNWQWRFQWSDIPNDLTAHLGALNKAYGRDLTSRS